MSDSSDEDDANQFDDAEDDIEIEAVPVPVPAVAAVVRPHEAPQGKPAAAAAALAAAKKEKLKKELEESKQQHQQQEEEEDDDVVAVAVAEPVGALSATATPGKRSHAEAYATPVADAVKPPPKKKHRKSSAKKTPAASSSKKSKASSSGGGGTPAVEILEGPSLDSPMDPITDVDYENLIRLMEHFCKVPLLAELSRPVTLLHPELVAAYSKIVTHPIDLGLVCRKIRRREYRTTREVQFDMWRIFSNCIKYHSHPSNKEAVPSFVSISLHLREFFEALWQEHMLPSDPPPRASGSLKNNVEARYLEETFTKREEDRKRRLIISGLTVFSQVCLKMSTDKLATFISNQGRLDRLDAEPIFPSASGEPLPGIDEDDRKDLDVVKERLLALRAKLMQILEDSGEYTVEQYDSELRQSYTTDVFENNPALRFRVRNRMNRFFQKIVVPINEANMRGVTQSSIWGCMAAAIWARESSKKPFWPALVLGIMAPDDQKEDWHWALTERNELRLPDSLRTQLTAGKRKAELALRRQSQGHADPQSFFLVEFLGTHEFIWVRETDIVESFEPEDDPNVKMAAAKKKRSGRSSSATVIGTAKYQTAVEEAKWALEEFEIQLQDACGETGGEDDQEGEDGNYSYGVLNVSDEEADEAYADLKEMTPDEIEEANELIVTRGLIDFSVTGRKNAKKRAQALKKQKQEAEKKEKLEKQKKKHVEQTKKKRKESVSSKAKDREKEREEKKEMKELEKRRKKRSREREKALKVTAKALAPKRRRVSTGEEDQRKSISGDNLVLDKRARATAIVTGYLTRMAKNDEYKSLGLAGIMSIPAAMVDSSGLLGMSLAFRAAAGELTMPQESGEQEQKKPWDAIDVDSAKTSKERTERLQKQVELLENEIKSVKSATEKRLQLAEEAVKARVALDRDIAKDELAARVNPFAKKKKKVTDSTTKSTAEDSPAGKSDQGNDEQMKDVDMETPSKEATEEAFSTAPQTSEVASEDKMLTETD